MKECPACNYCYPDNINYCSRDGSPVVQSISCAPLLAERYELKRQIGQGRLGTVYYAWDHQAKREISIRLLPPRFFPNRQVLEQFARQFEPLILIKSPYVVQVFAWGELDTGHIFIVSDFVRGRSLREELKKGRPIPVDQAVEIICQVCQGVASAHRVNVLHRDLKPDNIFFELCETEMRTRVADFAIATMVANQAGSATTDTGSVIMRVPLYSSPEECSAQPLDQRSDIYSLGVILYEMLTAKVPFQAPTPMAMAIKHVSERPRPPRELNSDIPEALEAVLLQALEKNPQRRPATAEAFAEALQKAMAGSGTLLPTNKLQVGASGALPNTNFHSAPLSESGSVERPLPPEAGLPVRLAIIDADNEGNQSHTINGKVIDLSLQGMHIQTSAVESDSLNIIKDHTVAFKNRLNIEIDLPVGTVHIEGFAVWYKPAPDGRNWNVGIYIKEMPRVDRELYEEYLGGATQEE
ncbi:MAG: serine/threonine-protein kinase [Acidobacteriota bacterium]